LWFEGAYSLGLNLYRNEQAVDPVSISQRSNSFFLVQVYEQSTHCPSYSILSSGEHKIPIIHQTSFIFLYPFSSKREIVYAR
jgi:hypothetical protein